MRFSSSFLLLAALELTGPLAARTSPRTCVDTSRIRNWIVGNDETLLLDAGTRKYRVTLLQSCFNLGTSPRLDFKADPITGRICSSSLDAIRVQGQQCRIAKIQEIDKATFKAAQGRKKISLKAKKAAQAAGDPEQP